MSAFIKHVITIYEDEVQRESISVGVDELERAAGYAETILANAKDEYNVDILTAIACVLRTIQDYSYNDGVAYITDVLESLAYRHEDGGANDELGA